MKLKVLLIASTLFLALASAQTGAGFVDSKYDRQLKRDLDALTRVIEEMENEQRQYQSMERQSQYLEHIAFGIRDSLRLQSLKRKQSDSSRRIDALTLEILNLSRRLEDPRKRHALAQRLSESPLQHKPPQASDPPEALIPDPDILSAQGIDLAALELIRKGETLDQARLSIIDGLDPERVNAFYLGLSKAARFELYELAEALVFSKGIAFEEARRSALYFYFYGR